jgi:hypothetical protein
VAEIGKLKERKVAAKKAAQRNRGRGRECPHPFFPIGVTTMNRDEDLAMAIRLARRTDQVQVLWLSKLCGWSVSPYPINAEYADVDRPEAIRYILPFGEVTKLRGANS